MGRVKWVGLALVSVSVGALSARPASAQSAGTSSSATSLSPADKQRALDLFEAGKTAYRQGRFKDAVDQLQQAYDLSHEAVLRYDLARAYEGLGDLAGAVREYEAYLAEQPSIPDRAGIAQRVETLKQELAERERLVRAQQAAEQRAASTQTAQPTAPPESAPPPPPHASPWPWIVVGVGAAGLAAGGVMSAVALSFHGDAEHASSQQSEADDNNRANGWITAARVAFVAGGVAAAAGLTWWFFTREPSDGGAVRAGLRVSPRDVAFAVQGF